jgi:Protein of unknown function (DUF2510)
MFGRKRRAAKEAEAKAQALADLRTAIVGLIGIAEGGTNEPPGWSLILKPGERLVYPMTGVGLFEPRREPGHWSGRSAGFSVPVTDGIRFRIGKSAGTFVQGNETPTVVDAGNVSFTTQRVVFQGGKYTREWLFSKLIGIVHDANQPWTAIQVTNREKTSGIVYTGLSPDVVRLGLAVAVAIFNGEAAEVTKELREQLDELGPGLPAAVMAGEAPVTAPASGPGPADTTREPGAVATSAPSSHDGQAPLPPPMWATDPSGRHQLRYWDGAAWTDYVSDDGHDFHEPFLRGSS